MNNGTLEEPSYGEFDLFVPQLSERHLDRLHASDI